MISWRTESFLCCLCLKVIHEEGKQGEKFNSLQLFWTFYTSAVSYSSEWNKKCSKYKTVKYQYHHCQFTSCWSSRWICLDKKSHSKAQNSDSIWINIWLHHKFPEWNRKSSRKLCNSWDNASQNLRS